MNRRRRAIVAALMLTLGATFAVGVSPAHAATKTYTASETIPVPPATSFHGSAGGDGWDVSMTPRAVYNVFHHNSQLLVACHLQSDASACGSPRHITDTDGSDFASQGHSATYIDQANGHLYTWGTRVGDRSAGVVCVDTTLPDTTANPFCGYTKMTGAGEAALPGGWGTVSNPLRIGTKWYAFNSFAGSATSPTSAANTLLCFDFATQAACAGSPFRVGLSGTFTNPQPAPAIGQAGGKVILPYSTTAFRGITCFDPATGAVCSGTWPVSNSRAPNGYGAPFPVLAADGSARGFCLSSGQSGDCYDLTGAALAAPAGLTSTITATQAWNGPAVTLGDRIYVANGTVDKVQCYDFGSAASCPNFPRSTSTPFGSANYIYTVNTDPQRPSCIWVNADGGAAQIQNFDAFTGGACANGTIRVLASTLVAPGAQCVPDSYTQVAVTDPVRTGYTDGSVAFLDGNGNAIAAYPDRQLDNQGAVDLTDLSLNTDTGLPQFLITLNQPTGATPTAVTVQLTWTGVVDPVCHPPLAPADPVGPADVSITKTASASQVLSGDTVVYTLTATNSAAAGEATATTVTDPLPAGVTVTSVDPGCTVAARTVTCDAGTLAAGTSKAFHVTTKVDEVPMPPDPNTAHQVDVQKTESSLGAQAGASASADVACPGGSTATEGGVRLDGVDQGNVFSKVAVVASRPTADGRGWFATIRNATAGQAQGKVWVSCVRDSTYGGKGHEHQLQITSPAATTATVPAGGGTVATPSCGDGKVAVAPGYALTSGTGTVVASFASGDHWVFVLDSANGASGTFTQSCLSPYTTVAASHRHRLVTSTQSQAGSVAAGASVEVRQDCDPGNTNPYGDTVGVVSSVSSDSGLVYRGADPQARIRVYRFTNESASTKSWSVALTCVAIRTTGEPKALTITNTATVSTTSQDANTTDNTSTATVTAHGEGWVGPVTSRGTVTGNDKHATVTVPVTAGSAMGVRASLVTVTRVKGMPAGTVVATVATRVRAGRGQDLRLSVTQGHAHVMRSSRAPATKLVLRTIDGNTLSYRMQLTH